MQDFDFDERDLKLLHALQIRPRAPWTALAPGVRADAVTLARRWNFLSGEGLAWVATYRGRGSNVAFALVEVECSPASMAAVTEELAAEPDVLSIDHTAGGRDMVITVVCRDEASLGRFILDRLPTVNGVRSTRTHLGINLVADARSWRLRSLQDHEVKLIERAAPQPSPAVKGASADLEEQLFWILRADGRASITEISQKLGISPPRAKSALGAALAQDRIVVRLEIARTLSPWPVNVWYFLRVPATQVEAVAARLVGLGEVRLVVTTGGLYSIVMSVWLRRLEDMTILERQLGERLPMVEIMDRSVVLRTPKHVGVRLDPSGRRIM
ncbi:Lrp/AsnC family transcriptional regulator [Arthrobacter sp. StoSoilB5]|uniref:Lrp/AsnC family transcriptional regulator n=1 Tax=Arthrobacter sp. StoSoilB5 TaxID=2830992 RepID=UPI001CC4A213|nr:Lrp/AsnC family transcriptional regulator [Arthrobacter sp. StoSoilB5]BCW45473.1 AsnC family transcriptional regulator [Arthrobacter sp. StoSoilB5]